MFNDCVLLTAIDGRTVSIIQRKADGTGGAYGSKGGHCEVSVDDIDGTAGFLTLEEFRDYLNLCFPADQYPAKRKFSEG